MRKLSSVFLIASAISLPAFVVACGDDPAPTVPPSNTGGKTTGGDTNGGDTNGGDTNGGDTNGGDTNGGDTNGGDTSGGVAGTGVAGTGGNAGGEGGTGGVAPACPAPTKTATVTGTIDADTTWTADTVYTLDGLVRVAAGKTLTIEPCTTVKGKSGQSPASTLIVNRGARLIAEGEANKPIVLTSDKPVGSRKQGDWGGLIFIGEAPTRSGTKADFAIEGLSTTDPLNLAGGTDETADCGSLAYVRVEFSGFEIAAGKEVNGISWYACGSKTKAHHVMVNTTNDDCFEWFGGGFNADHLVCHGAGDDMFDADDGFNGTFDTLLGVARAPRKSDPNGFEMDGDDDTAGTRDTKLKTNNVTLCGLPAGSGTQWGMVLRQGLFLDIDNMAISGFQNGSFDLRTTTATTDPTPTELARLTVKNSFALYASTLGQSVADGAWFTGVASNKSGTAPSILGYTAADCTQNGGPSAKVLGSNKGAFKGGSDWTAGTWINWAPN